jgi:hypothetical protein
LDAIDVTGLIRDLVCAAEGKGSGLAAVRRNNRRVGDPVDSSDQGEDAKQPPQTSLQFTDRLWHLALS